MILVIERKGIIKDINIVNNNIEKHMKNEMPNWLKYAIIAVGIILMVLVIIWVIENRVAIYKQWVKKQNEIRALILEQARLIKKKLILDRFAGIAVMFVKFLIIFSIGVLSHLLVKYYKCDPISSIVTASGAIGLIYTIVCSLIYKKVYGINELQKIIELRIVKTIYFIGRLEPSRLIEINQQLVIKKEEALKLKKQLK